MKAMYDIELDAIVVDGVEIPRQSIQVLGLESSQEHVDPAQMLADLGDITLEYEGVKYSLGSWVDMDEETSEVLLEWLSPT